MKPTATKDLLAANFMLILIPSSNVRMQARFLSETLVEFQRITRR
jgi:hypothetical protein